MSIYQIKTNQRAADLSLSITITILNQARYSTQNQNINNRQQIRISSASSFLFYDSHRRHQDFLRGVDWKVRDSSSAESSMSMDMFPWEFLLLVEGWALT